MNREDIIRMAREASNTPIDHHATPDLFGVSQIERFADLVAAAEREACAKVCDDKAKETFSGQCQTWGDYFARAIRARSEK